MTKQSNWLRHCIYLAYQEASQTNINLMVSKGFKEIEKGIVIRIKYANGWETARTNNLVL